MVVAVDGRTVLSQDVAATTWSGYSASVALADGPDSTSTSSATAVTRPRRATCERN
jgi:hypothetical protein